VNISKCHVYSYYKLCSLLVRTTASLCQKKTTFGSTRPTKCIYREIIFEWFYNVLYHCCTRSSDIITLFLLATTVSVGCSNCSLLEKIAFTLKVLKNTIDTFLNSTIRSQHLIWANFLVEMELYNFSSQRGNFYW